MKRFIYLFLLAIASRAHAIVITDPLGCGKNGFDCAISKVLGGFAIIAAPILTIMMLYGGFQMMTAAGDPEKFTTGRRTLLYSAIGFVVALIAGSVPQLLRSLFS